MTISWLFSFISTLPVEDWFGSGDYRFSVSYHAFVSGPLFEIGIPKGYVQ